MRSRGGTFGALTCKAAQDWCSRFAPGVSVEPTRDGYEVIDPYRPGARYQGKTPRNALREAGFIVLHNFSGEPRS